MSTCYACVKVAVTSEHVPPQCIFPEKKDLAEGMDLRRNLITVPSCDDHNLRKSGDDEYLMYVLSMNLPAGEIAAHHFSTKIMRAIDRRPALVNSLVKNNTPVIVKDRTTGETYETSALEVDGQRVDRIFSNIALGIYFHHFNKRWEDNLRVQPNFLSFLHEPNAQQRNAQIAELARYADQFFADVEHFGENPSVFTYQVVQPDRRIHALMRLNFYTGCKVTVFLGKSRGLQVTSVLGGLRYA